MTLEKLEQVLEFAHEVNQRSREAALEALRSFSGTQLGKFRENDEAVAALTEAQESLAAGNEEQAAEAFRKFLKTRYGYREDELTKMSEAEHQRFKFSTAEIATYFSGRQGQETALNDGWTKLGATYLTQIKRAQDHLRDLRVRAIQGKKKEGASAEFDQSVSEFNRIAGMAGLPVLPTDIWSTLGFIKDQYDFWRSELRNAFQVAAAGGFQMEDVGQFMIELANQRADFPSLAQEIDKVMLSLKQSLPLISNPQLQEANKHIRRASLLLTDTMGKLGQDTADLARITNKTPEDVLAAFLTLHEAARQRNEIPGQNATDTVPSLAVLHQAFVDLTKEGAKWGIGLEESMFLTTHFSQEINNGLLSVQDLINLASALSRVPLGMAGAVGMDMVKMMGDDPHYRTLVDVLKTQMGSVMGMDRMMQYITTGSMGLEEARKEFPQLTQENIQELQRELLAMRNQYAEIRGGQLGGSPAERRYNILMILNQMFGVNTGGTVEQQEAARGFGIRAEPIPKPTPGGLAYADWIYSPALDALQNENENQIKVLAGHAQALLTRINVFIATRLGIQPQKVSGTDITYATPGMTTVNIGGRSVEVSEQIAPALEKVNQQMIAAGLGPLRITEGYRTPERQQELWGKSQRGEIGQAARPETSLHPRGLAVDIDPRQYKIAQPFLRTAGLINPLLGDPGHFQPSNIPLRSAPPTSAGNTINVQITVPPGTIYGDIPAIAARGAEAAIKAAYPSAQ